MAGRRVVAPTVATAAAASLAMIVINFATEAKTNPWWWAAVVGVTGLVALVAVWLDARNTHTPEAPDEGGGQRVEHSRIERDNIQIGNLPRALLLAVGGVTTVLAVLGALVLTGALGPAVNLPVSSGPTHPSATATAPTAFLTDLVPASSGETDNLANPGRGLSTLGGTPFPHSLQLPVGGAGDKSVTYDLSGYRALRATLGVESVIAGQVNDQPVRFQVLIDGARVFDQQVSQNKPAPVEIPLPAGTHLVVLRAAEPGARGIAVLGDATALGVTS